MDMRMRLPNSIIKPTHPIHKPPRLSPRKSLRAHNKLAHQTIYTRNTNLNKKSRHSRFPSRTCASNSFKQNWAQLQNNTANAEVRSVWRIRHLITQLQLISWSPRRCTFFCLIFFMSTKNACRFLTEILCEEYMFTTHAVDYELSAHKLRTDQQPLTRQIE